MKLTLAGAPGTGKSTVRAALAERYGLKIKATGDFMREVAQRYGYNDITRFLVEYVSAHPEIDHEVDEEQRRFGREHYDFVLDAHLGFHFVPDSIKIFLKCDPQVAAQRVLNAKRATESAQDIETALASNQRRISTMRENFQRLYQVDIHDENHFDLVVDTTQLSPEQVFLQITKYLDARGR